MHRLLTKVGPLWDKLKTAQWREKYIFWVLLAAFLLTLAPMALIAPYDVPSSDDYTYGIATHAVWQATHSLPAVLRAAADQAADVYFTWQGSFAAIFLFGLQPAVFGEELYFITPFIMLALLFAGVSFLCAAVLRRLFGAGRYQTGIVVILVLAACTQLLPQAVQAFYWYNGSIYYTGIFGLSLLLYGGVIRYCAPPQDRAGSRASRAGLLVWMSLLALIVGGGNLVTGLTTAIVFAGVLAYMALRRRRQMAGLLIPFAIFFAGFLANILAPGNAVRQANFTTGLDPVLAVIYSLLAGANAVQDWLTPPYLWMLAFLIPLFWTVASRSRFSFPFPLLAVFLSCCLLSAMYAPNAYASGSRGLGRLVDIIYYAFVLLSVFDLFYCVGWARRSLLAWAERRGLTAGQPRYTPLFCLVLAGLLATSVFPFEENRTITSVSAAISLVTHEADAYRDTYRQRLAILRDEDQPDAVLPPYTARPYVLFSADFSDDPADWMNDKAQQFYGKDSVVVAQPEP